MRGLFWWTGIFVTVAGMAYAAGLFAGAASAQPPLPAIPFPPPGLPPPPPGLPPVIPTPPTNGTDSRGVGVGVSVVPPEFTVGMPNSKLYGAPTRIGVDATVPGEPMTFGTPPGPPPPNPNLAFGRVPYIYTGQTLGSGVRMGAMGGGLEDPHGNPPATQPNPESSPPAEQQPVKPPPPAL
jgi:hypothetical protein